MARKVSPGALYSWTMKLDDYKKKETFNSRLNHLETELPRIQPSRFTSSFINIRPPVFITTFGWNSMAF